MVDQQIAVTILGAVVTGLLLAIAGIDLGLEWRHQRPLGQRLAYWSRRYPLFTAGLAIIFGAMLGHFFWPP